VIASLLLLLQAQNPLAVMVDRTRPDENILSYSIAISLLDSTRISAGVTIRYLVVAGDGPLALDFDSALVIDSIMSPAGRIPAADGRRGAAARAGWQLRRGGLGWVLAVPRWGTPGDTLQVSVFYHGRPRDGLYLRPNQYGARSAFADNWPNRAHFWLPCNDDPADKATASFAVLVPRGWRAVANGALMGVDTLADSTTRWRWRAARPIPVYTMVVGAGRLAVTPLPTMDGVPESVWTFPEDSAFAINGPFQRVTMIVDAFTRLIGPFPYAKLAHVESSTRFGGMENSSAIFYAQAPYVNHSMTEDVVAHETAHQWFGDAVTERDWHHLWLSEGFASYLGPLFYELVGEPARFHEAMERNRRVYMASSVVDRPIIDTANKDIPSLLNENNYPKAAWVLHMLRGEIGDSAFFGGLRTYYATYRDSTALSSDFAGVMEHAAGRPLGWFFDQWLLQPGYPKLAVAWSYANGQLALEVAQTQPPEWGRFRVRLPIAVQLENGDTDTLTVPVEAREQTSYRRALAARPRRLVADPAATLLAETSVTAR
jgi:aminopeptidase N